MAFAETLSGYFADFGVTATLGGVAVTGIYDDAYADALGISGSGPSLLLPATSAASASLGASCVVGAISYTVSGIQPDGTGMTRLMLQEV